MNGGARAVRRGRPAADRAPASATATWTSAPARSTTRWRGCAAAQREGRALSIGLLGNAAEVLPELVRRGVARRRRHRPDQRARSAQRLRPGGPDRRAGRRAARTATPTTTWRASGEARARARRRDPRRCRPARRGGVRLRQRAARRWRRSTATTTRSPIPASSRPTSGRCSARARGRSAGSRCPATRPTSPRPTRRSSTCSATRSTSGAGSSWPRSASHSRGCRRGSAGSATASATCAGLRFNEMVAGGRAQGPDRDRPRPPRRRLGRLARSARPRRCATAPTRSPTGRSSTRWSTRRRGASWVSFHHGGGVGMGQSLHAGQVCVADGTPRPARADPPHAARRPRDGDRAARRRRLPGGDRGRRAARACGYRCSTP